MKEGIHGGMKKNEEILVKEGDGEKSANTQTRPSRPACGKRVRLRPPPVKKAVFKLGGKDRWNTLSLKN